MSNEKPKIKEVSLMVYRKFTRDFDSMGFRLGVSVEVRDGNPRDSWYQGRLFLEERIIEEKREVEKQFEWLKKEKEKGVVPKGVGSVGYRELELENIPMEEGVYLCKNIGDAISRIMFITDMKKVDVEKAVRDIKKMGVSEKDAIIELGALKGLALKFDSDGGGDKIVIDVREIVMTSPKAVLVELFGFGRKWIPKSCIQDGNMVDRMAKGVKTMLYVSEWFLNKEGIVY